MERSGPPIQRQPDGLLLACPRQFARPRPEKLAHFLDQGAGRERLLKKLHPRIEFAFVLDPADRMAGYEEHPGIGAKGS